MNKERDGVFKDIVNDTKKVFDNVSVNYRQKIVYNMLNAIRSNNQREFFWILFRVLNAYIEKNEVIILSKKIENIMPLNSSDFEKFAYSIILAIISAGGERDG